MTSNVIIILGLLCTTCGTLEKYAILSDVHVITLWSSCVVCGSSRRAIQLPLDYFKGDELFKYLTKEEMVELLI